MISCTEFIPSYSELFTFIEKKFGRKEVDVFWEFLFAPTGKSIPLVNHIQKEGIKGCYTYWAGSLNEEAADFTMYLNEKRGFFLINMHRCPSKGRLLELQKEFGLKPYHDYCLHCDYYRLAVEKCGLKYIYNFNGVEKASCSILIYEEKVFDGRVIIDDNTVIMDRKASDNEYFHKDFHNATNNGVEYLATKFGVSVLKEYLKDYTQNLYKNLINDIKEKGLVALKDMIVSTYEKEKSPDALKIDLSDNELKVEIAYCPAVKHLKETGRVVSPYFKYTTETVMQEIADSTNIKFKMLSYDNETGKAEYKFTK